MSPYRESENVSEEEIKVQGPPVWRLSAFWFAFAIVGVEAAAVYGNWPVPRQMVATIVGINAAVIGLNGDTLALLEASEIETRAKRIPDARPLRLHVSGDATTPFRAEALSKASRVWKGPVWTYTHAWRDVPRASWGDVSVLASCESLVDAKRAMASGYAAALVTPPHASPKAYVQDGVRVIPCPSQTKGVKCTDCRLCFDAPALLARNAVIAFETHGAQKKRALNVIA